MSITMGSACSGIGGAEVAALIADLPIRSEWAIEIADHQAAILAQRFRIPVHRDAYECGADNLAPVDLFCAGFPCQPFSVAGRRGGAKDPRNLWPEIARITEEIGPRAVLFENVPALRNPHPAGAISEDDEDAGEEAADALPGYLGTVLGDLVDLGYHVAWDGRSASSMGAHHRRDRVWIVGWKAGAVSDFDPFWPEDRAFDARLVGVWTGERWERPGLFGGDLVMKWPRAGIVRGREAYEVGTSSDASARAISWPTPTSHERSHTPRSVDHGAQLANEVNAIWQTPTVGNVTGVNKRRGGDRGDELLLPGQAAAIWPTVRTSDTNGAGAHGDGGLDLRTTIREALYPTPRAEDSEQTGAHSGTPDTLTSASRELWNTATVHLRDHVEPGPAWPTPNAEQFGVNVDLTNERRARYREKYRNNGFGLTTGQAAAEALTAPQWATPQAHDETKPDASRDGRFGSEHGGRNLNDQAANAVTSPDPWPTPNAYDAIEDYGKRAEAHGKHAMSLRHVPSEIWSTPVVSDSKGDGPIGGKAHDFQLKRGQLTAQAAESLWNTPAAADDRDRGGDVPAIRRRVERGQQINLGMEAGLAQQSKSGLINPRWVEALMGYPPGWTDLSITNPEAMIAPWEVARAWGADCYRVGDLEGTNPEYAGYWLWHPILGDLALPTAQRERQTKDRLVSLGNAWVPQVAAPIMARIVEALT